MPTYPLGPFFPFVSFALAERSFQMEQKNFDPLLALSSFASFWAIGFFPSAVYRYVAVLQMD